MKNNFLKGAYSFKRFGVFSLLICLIPILKAQQITAYEYWFDNAVANRLSKNLSIATSESIVLDSVNVSTLVDGIHTFNIRFKNATIWGTATTQLFYKSSNTRGNGVSAYEYWFDNDINNRTTRPLSIASQEVVVIDSANIAALSNGFHSIHIRFRNDVNWGSVSSYFFLKSGLNNNLVSYEYWLGNDFNSRKQKTITATNLLVVDSLNVDSLCRGKYFINYRFQTPNGWTTVYRDTFTKKTPAPFEAYADFIYHVGADNQTVFFTDSSKNVVSRKWYFENSEIPFPPDTTVNPSYKYSRAGNYLVKLVVKNRIGAACREDSITKNILVSGINSVLPNRAANNGYFFTTIRGFGFLPTAKVELYRQNRSPVIATDTLIYISANEIRVKFKFINAELDSWSLRVIQSRDTFRLADGFTMEATTKFKPEVTISTPNALLRGREHKIIITISNNTSITGFAVPALIKINGKKNVKLLNKVIYDTITFSRSLLNSLKDSTEFSTVLERGSIDSVKYAFLILPIIQPYSSINIDLLVKSNEESPLKLDVKVGRRFLDSAFLRDNGVVLRSAISDECMNAYIDLAFELLGSAPFPVGCPFGVVGSLKNLGDAIKSGNGLDYFNFGVSAASAAAGCIPGGTALKSLSREFLESLGTGWGFGGASAKAVDKCKDEDPPESKKSNIPTRNSSDPNLKIGLIGKNALNSINGKELMPFTIYFENVDTATAPASEVRILDQLDTTVFDISTLQFTGFGFGDSSYTLPPQSKTFVREIDFRPRKNMKLRVTGDLDATGKLMWYWGSFDPKTNDVTQNIDDGFLPPNIRKPEGEGFVSYTIRPKANLPHLTTLRNKADIVFDYNDAIVTPTWINTVDRVAPTSRVNSIRRVQGDTVFMLKWSGNDTHAGVMDYNIYVSEENGAYQILYRSIESDSALFVGKIGKRYSFYSVARDYVGNLESKTPIAEVSTGRVATNEIDEKGNWLGQNIPNPFSGTTTIPFYLSGIHQKVKIDILSITGSIVRTVYNSDFIKGEQTVSVNLSDLPSGIYFYRLSADGKTLTKKLILNN